MQKKYLSKILRLLDKFKLINDLFPMSHKPSFTYSAMSVSGLKSSKAG